MKHALLAFALLAGSSTTIHAQDQSEFQIWGALLGTGHLSKSTPRLAFWLFTDDAAKPVRFISSVPRSALW